MWCCEPIRCCLRLVDPFRGVSRLGAVNLFGAVYVLWADCGLNRFRVVNRFDALNQIRVVYAL